MIGVAFKRLLNIHGFIIPYGGANLALDLGLQLIPKGKFTCWNERLILAGTNNAVGRPVGFTAQI